VVKKLNYKSILTDIYGLIEDSKKIITYSQINIKTIKKIDEGFYFLDQLGISVQGADANKCINEIISQCVKNKIKISFEIEFKWCIISFSSSSVKMVVFIFSYINLFNNFRNIYELS